MVIELVWCCLRRWWPLLRRIFFQSSGRDESTVAAENDAGQDPAHTWWPPPVNAMWADIRTLRKSGTGPAQNQKDSFTNSGPPLYWAPFLPVSQPI